MPVKRPRQCLESLGFVVLHTPGLARAWSYEFSDGSSILVTDVAGYDLPESGGPYSVIWLSRREEIRKYVPAIFQAKYVYRFVLRLQRQFQFQLQNHDPDSLSSE